LHCRGILAFFLLYLHCRGILAFFLLYLANNNAKRSGDE
jgi:hypothetical protein